MNVASKGNELVTEIREGDPSVTLINVFTTKAGLQNAFIEAQTAEYKRLAGKIPGALTVNLHRGLDGRTVVNYAQFASKEAYDAWLNSNLFKEHYERIKDLVDKVEPRLFEVAYIQHDG